MATSLDDLWADLYTEFKKRKYVKSIQVYPLSEQHPNDRAMDLMILDGDELVPFYINSPDGKKVFWSDFGHETMLGQLQSPKLVAQTFDRLMAYAPKVQMLKKK